MTIYTATRRSQMESYRRMAKDKYGDRYESRVGPYRSILVMYCRRLKKSLEEGALDLIAVLRARGKLNNHHRAVLFSAALDAEERKLLDNPDLSAN